MTFLQFIKLVIRNLKWLIGVAVMMSSLIYFSTSEGPSEYTTHTLVYTGLASGYTLESQGKTKVDYFSVNNAFDNLIKLIDSRETRTEVGIRLLAHHLRMEKVDTFYISLEHYEELHEFVGDSLKEKVVDKNSFEQTVLNIYAIKKHHINNAIYELLNDEESFYSVEQVSKPKFSRVLTSDMVEGKYTCEDPGICKQTLDILIEVFSNRHRRLKEGETDNVVAFFEKQSEKVYQKLTKEENELKHFRETNRIINYYEQTKYISSKKEDLDEQVSNEKMILEGAKSSVKRIEKELEHRDIVGIHGQKLIQHRQDLSKYTKSLGIEEMKEDSDKTKIVALSFKIDSLKRILKRDVESLYTQNHSLEGIPVKTLLNEWLTNIIIVEESTSKAEILENRRKDFEQTYNRFAPLGSSLKRYDRKINVIEQEYLQLLHSLNLSRMRKQNIALSSGLDVIDPPFYPIEPLPSKRKLLVVVGGVVGFVLTLVILLALEFFDSTIKTEQNAKEQIGLDVLGAYPIIPNKIPSRIDYQYVTQRLIELTTQEIRKEISLEEREPKVVVFFSMKKGEGKSLLITKVANYLREINGELLCLSPKFSQSKDDELSTFLTESNHIDNIEYDVPKKFLETITYRELIADQKDIQSKKYDYVLIEIPSLLDYGCPIHLMQNAEISLLVAKANRVWTKADNRMLQKTLNFFNKKPMIILNGMKLDFLEEIIGEIPKGRSYIRYLLKRIIKLDFKSRTKFV